MLIEHHRYLGAAPSQRVPARNSHANAFKNRSLATWMETNLPEGFIVFAFPEAVRQRLRTSNLCESRHQHIRRRTRAAAIFSNPESCLRLVSAIFIEISEAYLNPQLLK